MRFAAERGPSRLSREQALEKRVLALEQQLGLGLAPLDARAAQEKIRWVGLLRGGDYDEGGGGGGEEEENEDEKEERVVED